MQGLAAFGLGFLAGAGPVAGLGAISDRYVHDSYTGLALYGYDPVGYFVDRRPIVGNRWFEVVYDGAYWRFANPGNAAAFVDRPEVYLPVYGGYNPVAVASGRLEPGDPLFFAIYDNRLHLFATLEDRDAFMADPESVQILANARWPGLAETLSR